MGLVARNPGQSETQTSLPSHRETSQKSEISPVASLDVILSKKRITKVLTSLPGYAGWSAPALCCSQTPKARFSGIEAHIFIFTSL